MSDMGNAEMLTAADMAWIYVGPGQENLTHHAERETQAAWAELYTEAGELLLAMSRRDSLASTFWGPDRSELLTREALAQVPYVQTITELDLHMILDLETDAWRAS
jgi:hypothetical protein